MAEAGSIRRFGNSLQPSTSDIHVDEELLKTVQKQFSGNILRTKEEGKTLKDDVLPEIEKADNLDKSEEFSESDNELCGNILKIRDEFDVIKKIISDTVTFEDTDNELTAFECNDDQSLKLPECTPFLVPGRSCSETLKEFIGKSDFGIIWKENLQSHKGSSKNAESQEFSLMKTKGQMNVEKRMELDDSLKADGESKASLEHGISVAKSNAMSSKSKVCLRNVLFGNVNDMFDIGNVSVGKGNISVGIGNALVNNSDALINNGIVLVGNASGNGNATVGIQPDDRSNTLPSLNPYKSMPQKPPDPTQYTISPELKNILQSNLLLKSEQTRRALQGEWQGEGGYNERPLNRFHPYKQQKVSQDKSKKFQTSLPILPEFE